MAAVRDQLGLDRKVVAMIGDGTMTDTMDGFGDRIKSLAYRIEGGA